MSIRYTTGRRISRGEQLFISYGREEDLWWHRPSRPQSSEYHSGSALEEDPLQAMNDLFEN